MSHSNSSLNCFANCMKAFEHRYILHTAPNKPPSPHLIFGTMAHDVLYKAGTLRDAVNDGVVDKNEYWQVIPSELLYQDLKQEFSINSWNNYFMPVIKQTAEYENKLREELVDSSIEREVKLQLTVDELKEYGIFGIDQPLVGIVDCLIYNKKEAIILDYKFSSSRKTQDDFDMNSQLPLYALMVHIKYDIPLHNIRYGYIDIPKIEFGKPTILTNGTLSKAKTQHLSQELYEKAVLAIHGEDDKYNCKPGGFYYDAWCNFAMNKAAYLSIQYLDIDVYNGVLTDLFEAAQLIDKMIRDKLPFVKKYDSYSCKSCEYLNSCKPWLEV